MLRLSSEMSSLFGSSDNAETTFGSSTLPKGGDGELQEFLMMEKQKAQLNAQVGANRGPGGCRVSPF